MRNQARLRRAAARGSRPAWAVAFGLVLVTLLTLISPVLYAASPAAPGPAPQAPGLAELDAAIARSERFIEGLYKDIDADGSTLSEYYAFPLRVHLTQDDTWLLAGEDVQAFCRDGQCYTTTDISGVENLQTSEQFTIDFRSPRSLHAPQLHVSIDWADSPSTYAVRLTTTAFDDAATDAEVYLADRYLGTLSSTSVGDVLSFAIDAAQPSSLQSFRYTVRHGNQEGQNYYWYKQDLGRFEKLANFEARWGFVLDFDLRAPIWGYGRAFDDDMMFETDASDGRDIFHDCSVRSSSTPLAYPYRSKVCTAGPNVYTAISRFDPLSPTIAALQGLNKYADPSHRIEVLPGNAKSIWSMTSDLEATFDRLGFGMPACNPVACDHNSASGIRTFEFGALETLLGYTYGREASQQRADAVAQLTLAAQIGDDGYARTVDGDFVRPAQRGGFYLAWDRSKHYRLDRQLPYQLLDQQLNMPDEYKGLVLTNMETAHDAYAFLTLYRCKKYGVGCPSALAKPADA